MDISAPALRYFVAVADELHFARAADRLHITPPTLSQQIARLELAIGGRLFERTPRAVALTPLGEELLPLAREAVRSHEAVLAWASRAATHPAALRVGVVAGGGGGGLTSEILAALVARLPEVPLQLVRLGFFDVGPAVREGGVDVALTLAPVGPSKDLSVQELLSEPRVLVVREDSPLAGRASIRIDETNNLAFVVPSGAAGEGLAWWLVDPRPDGTRPRVVAVADDVEGLLELCAAGIGVNIATSSAFREQSRAGLALVEIVDVEPARVVLVRSERPRHGAVAAFERIAIDVASAFGRGAGYADHST